MIELQGISGMGEGRLRLIQRALADREPSGVSIRAVLDRSWDDPQQNALAVVVRQPRWMRTVCPGVHLRSAREDEIDFLIVLGRRAIERTDAELLITMVHELEHVRQEWSAPGIGWIGDAVYQFVAATRAMRERFKLPLEYHAEAAAAVYVSSVLGREVVQAYYDAFGDYRQPFGRLSIEDLRDARADLASFLRQYWKAFVAWFGGVVRYDLPTIQEIESFMKRYASV